MSIPLPQKISPCPINEAIVEIRFQTKSDFVGDAVFGLVYNAFKNDYPKVNKQPVLQIPEQMRISDPALMFLPEYHLTSGKFKLLVGQRVLSIVVAGEYCGWATFSARVDSAIERISSLDFIESVSRLGLRYINVFGFNIFEQSTLKLVQGGEPMKTKSSRIVTQMESGNFEHTLTMANGLAVRDGTSVIGESIIDIDTAMSTNLTDFFNNRIALIEDAHQKEKELFFGLLAPEYLNTLTPTY